jgi:hypothetical protein
MQRERNALIPARITNRRKLKPQEWKYASMSVLMFAAKRHFDIFVERMKILNRDLTFYETNRIVARSSASIRRGSSVHGVVFAERDAASGDCRKQTTLSLSPEDSAV